MATHVYTVHESPEAPRDRLDRAEQLAYVKEGFSRSAALLTPVWLIGNGMWFVLVGYLGALAVIVVLVWLLGISAGWAILLASVMHVAIGLEADELKRWTLERRGWHEIGSVTGRNAEECERRFLEAWLPTLRSMAAGGVGPWSQSATIGLQRPGLISRLFRR